VQQSIRRCEKRDESSKRFFVLETTIALLARTPSCGSPPQVIFAQ
jgi:hypothetical protein